jgi:hypothetical protein
MVQKPLDITSPSIGGIPDIGLYALQGGLIVTTATKPDKNSLSRSPPWDNGNGPGPHTENRGSFCVDF